jgi:hypothetical protein
MRNLRILISVTPPMTVIGTERFLKDTRDLMPEVERTELVAFIAANPESGDFNP